MKRAFWVFAVCIWAAVSVGVTRVAASDVAIVPVADQRALDKLFEQLKTANTETEARAVTELIWRQWFQHPNGAVQHLMNRAQLLRRSSDFQQALSVLDQIVELAPDYSEGWNQRATVLYMLGRDRDSVADIQKVLKLEPRHFGALSGLGLLHIRAKNWQSAIKSFERALKVHPFLRERAAIPKLKEKLRGKSL